MGGQNEDGGKGEWGGCVMAVGEDGRLWLAGKVTAGLARSNGSLLHVG